MESQLKKDTGAKWAHRSAGPACATQRHKHMLLVSIQYCSGIPIKQQTTTHTGKTTHQGLERGCWGVALQLLLFFSFLSQLVPISFHPRQGAWVCYPELFPRGLVCRDGRARPQRGARSRRGRRRGRRGGACRTLKSNNTIHCIDRNNRCDALRSDGDV